MRETGEGGKEREIPLSLQRECVQCGKEAGEEEDDDVRVGGRYKGRSALASFFALGWSPFFSTRLESFEPFFCRCGFYFYIYILPRSKNNIFVTVKLNITCKSSKVIFLFSVIDCLLL